MRGWKDFKIELTYDYEGTPFKTIVTIRATHRSMALFVAKRDYPRASAYEIIA